MDFTKEKILIAYFSHSGNTRKLAEMLVPLTGGDAFAIIPDKPYPDDYDTVVAQAKKESEAKYLPPIHPLPVNLSEYGVVFIGSPVWWYTVAPPALSFASQAKLAGKVIIPFVTHEGGGKSNSFTDIQKMQPDAKMLGGFEARGSRIEGVQRELISWIATLSK